MVVRFFPRQLVELCRSECRATHRMRRWRYGLWGLVLIVSLSGCAQQAERANRTAQNDAATGGQVRVASAGANAINDNRASGTKWTTSTRSGSEEFGLSKQELVEYVEGIESAIGACMRAAGFEYVAVDYNTVRRGMTSDKSLPGYSESQFLREYGFGIATLYDGKPPQLSAQETAAKIGLGEQNARIFAALSPADQVAYTRTLFGEYPQATLAVSLEAENFSLTGGCTRTAIEQFFTPDELSATYINPFDLQNQQSPRMAERYKRFAECMHSHGFNYSLEQEIEPDLRRRLYAITKHEPVEALSAEAKAALAQLRQEEVAIAAALLDCGEP